MTGVPFRRVCAGDAVPDKEAITVELDDGEIAIFRDGELFWAVAGRCPHAFEEMSKAVLDSAAQTVTCLAHHYCYDLKTGKSLQPAPGIAWLKIYPLEIRDGEIYVRFEPEEEW